MIPKKYEFILFAFLMSMFMTILMSFVVTLINVGYSEIFFNQWLDAFMKSYVIAFPTVLIVVPIVRRVVKRLIVDQ